MNEIIINMKCGSSVKIIDEEDKNHEDVAKKVSSLFSVTNIAIASSNESSVVLRPSDISTIEIKPIKEEITQQEEPEEIDIKEDEIIEEKEVKEEIVEDIITDYDEG